MFDDAQMIDKQQAGFWFMVSCVVSASMFLVIAVASCTSSETFSQIYSAVTDFLSLSRTRLSATLRTSPNLGHFACYAILSLSLSSVLSRRKPYMAPMIVFSFGIIMEIVQLFIPSRDPSVYDIGFNIMGITVGFGIYRVWVAARHRFNTPR